jgi:2-polyprenyl-6-methoxyphenol hydroxylase-like FAD-dependent oxidoreductase
MAIMAIMTMMTMMAMVAMVAMMAVMAVTEYAVVIARGGPTGLMLAGELALAGVDVAIIVPRASQDLAGSRAGGLHACTIGVLDQRGIADRFLSSGQVTQVAGFAWIPLDISDCPARYPYGLALWQNRTEELLAGWDGELGVPNSRGREVTGFAQDDTGVDIALADGQSLQADYLVGCDGGRSRVTCSPHLTVGAYRNRQGERLHASTLARTPARPDVLYARGVPSPQRAGEGAGRQRLRSRP